MPGHVSNDNMANYTAPGMAEPEDAPVFREGSVLSRSETLRLVTNYYRIDSDRRRRAVYEMIKSMAEADEAAA